MHRTVVIDALFIVGLAAILIKKNIFPFPLTPAKLIGDDQLISIGAANC